MAAGLENAEFAYAPPFSAGKDVINNLGSMADNLLSGRVKTVNYKDLQELKDEIMLIDIRTPQDFDARTYRKRGKYPADRSPQQP